MAEVPQLRTSQIDLGAKPLDLKNIPKLDTSNFKPDVRRLDKSTLEKDFESRIERGMKEVPSYIRGIGEKATENIQDSPIVKYLKLPSQLLGQAVLDRPAQEIADLARTERERLDRFQKATENIQDVGKKELAEIERLSIGNIEGDSWTGSKKDLERYNKLVEDYQRKVSEATEEIESTGATIEREEIPEGEQLFFTPPEIETVGVGFGSLRKDIPVTEFTAGTPERLREQALSEGISFLGEGVSRGIELGLKASDRTQSVINPLGTFNQLGLFEQLKDKRAEVVGEFGKYAIPIAGTGFFVAETEKQLRDFDYNPIQFAKKEPLQAVLLGGVILTAGALRGVKLATTPKILEGSVRGGEVIRLPSTIKGARVSTERGVKNILRFQDKVIRTPVTAYQQTPFQRLLRKEPELVVLQRGQTYVGEPVANILGRGVDVGKPFIYRFGRVGKQGDIVNTKFFRTRVKQERISPESIIKLPRRDQFIFEKLFERTKTKSPTRADGIKDYVSEDEFLQKGLTEQIELAKVGTGRATTLTGTGTIITPIGKLDKGVKTFKIESGVKDVTKPSGRASGKVDVSKDILIQYPTISAEGTGVQVISGTGKKSSPEFLAQMWQTPKAIQRPDITKLVPKTPKSSTIVERTIKRPTESIWAGTGLYERTTGGASISQIGDSQQTTISPILLSANLEQQRIDTTPSTVTTTTPRTFTDLSPRVDTKIDTTQKPLLSLKTENKTDQLPRSLTRLQDRQVTTQTTQQKTALKQRLGLKTGLKTTTTTKTPLRTKTPLTPKVSKIKFPSTSKSPSISSLFGEEDDDFKVFVRKKGEDIELGQFGTLGQARTKLQSELIGTLRASGFITKGKTKLGFEDIGITGNQFRVSKKDPFRIVQKKTKRIKTGGEISEILKVRKSGGFL